MKEKIQSTGRFLSGMVMPNIGAFIAWGLITAFFIPTGWIPNEKIAVMVGPMLTYLLPLLIGYTGGKIVGGTRGAVVGAIATTGIIIGADIPMFFGAMIAGPIGGLCIKYFDKSVEGKIPAGFEMLVNNFSSGIIGGLLAIVCYLGISPLCVAITGLLEGGVQLLVNRGLLPVVGVFVEPAKVLFLNNAINHGVFTPMGIEQAASIGKSLFFMIESNPGPGAGLLLAYCLAGKGTAKSSAPGAFIIHFFGGIHELYFPYVLMNPILIIATIAGNITSIFLLQTLGGGLVAAASPGSIFAELMMTPRGGYMPNLLAIFISMAVTFALALVLLKIFAKDADLEESQRKVAEMKAEAKGTRVITDSASLTSVNMGSVRKIIFACDAGMGSSAMGATTLKKKFKAAGIEDIEIVHSPVSEVPRDTEVIITHEELKNRAGSAAPKARVITIKNFMGAPEYDILVREVQDARKE
jgi:PTS system mannitol-specific IIC component